MSASKIVLGLWPLAGITTIGVTDGDAERTIAAAIDSGITAFDTAYSYGFDGESDRVLGRFVQSDRDRFSVMGKVGQRWNENRERVVDGSPTQLIADAEESLRRSNLEYFDVLFLHSPDPDVPLAESAEAMDAIRRRGWCRRIGICNVTAEQLDAFSGSVRTDAIQCPLNLVQRESLETLIVPSADVGRDTYVFWTLMKGLLAGKIGRDHVFQEGDSRPGYAIFQGRLRTSIHDAIDQISAIAAEIDQTMAQVAIGWAISQPGVTAALVGARRPEQIGETAAAKVLSQEILDAIDSVVAECVAKTGSAIDP